VQDLDDLDITKTATEINDTIDNSKYQESYDSLLKLNGTTSKAVSGTFTSTIIGTVYIDFILNRNGTEAGIQQELLSFDDDERGIVRYDASGAFIIQSLDNGSFSKTNNTFTEKKRYKLAFRWTGSQWDIFVDGVKQTLLNVGSDQFAITKFVMGYRSYDNAKYTKGNYIDVRLITLAISEANALELTAGTKSSEEVMPKVSTEFVYNNFDSTNTITNKGITASADLTGTDLVLAEDITDFKALSEEGELLEDKYSRLVAGVTVTADTSAVSFSNLDINGDGGIYDYTIDGKTISAVEIGIRFNGISANYTHVRSYMSASLTTDGNITPTALYRISQSYAVIGVFKGSSAIAFGNGTISLNDSKVKWNSVMSSVISGTQGLSNYSGNNSAVISNITSMIFYNMGSQFKVGTTIKIYKRGN